VHEGEHEAELPSDDIDKGECCADDKIRREA
jgi:hypothetical protein